MKYWNALLPQAGTSVLRSLAIITFVAFAWLPSVAQDARVDPSARATAPAQTPAAPSAPASIILASAEEDYRIGVGDVIEIKIEDAPELSGRWQIGSTGTFAMSYLNNVMARNKTPQDIEKFIADGLRGKYLKNPQVKVIVTQFNSRSFFIQGYVRNPGIYQIGGKPTLLKLITIAGGLQEKHGSTAYILREIKGSAPLTTDEAGNSIAQAGNEAKPIEAASSRPRQIAETAGQDGEKAAPPIEGAQYDLIKASISGLLLGNMAQNFVIEPGDIVHIPQQDVFVVGGEVYAPGQFLLKEGTTLRQAISLAQGTTAKAALKRAIIFRDDKTTGKAQEILVDIGAVMSNKQPDMLIAPNDIIIVPNSRMKTVGSAMLSAFGIASMQRVPIGVR